jgi:hypothetical protein
MTLGLLERHSALRVDSRSATVVPKLNRLAHVAVRMQLPVVLAATRKSQVRRTAAGSPLLGGVNRITLLSLGATILGAMLFLSAFARLAAREPEANDLLAQSHAALGHLGLTIIAIVYVLITFWNG